jgi:multidrug efflux pump subunit AcrA (membrane-fusion protein)
MNRSILIVICDFLLVTLVAFSNFDTDKPQQVESRVSAAPKGIGGNQDMLGTLKLALEDEKQTRERLTADLRTQEQALAEREQKMKEYQASLRKTEEQAKQIEQQRSALAQQFAVAQTSLQDVQGKLTAASTENLISKEKLETLQAELKRREQEAQALQSKLSDTEKAAQAALAEKMQLNAQLQVSEAEKRLTKEQVAELRGTVAVEREEKAKLQAHATSLATNVATLAQKSTELTQEIRENRPLAPNAIFNQFLTNTITARFEAARSGIFGRDVNKSKSSQCILFTEGTQVYALFHVDDTPLTIWNPGTDWNRLTTVLAHGSVAFSGVRLSFLAQDPRVVVVPIGEPQARQYGVKIYKASPDPVKFQDAVIVGANENYYGECKFQIDASTPPQYVKVDRNLLKGLFGKFNPSRGDLVFAKNGDLMGIMVNGEYCAVLNKVTPTRTINLGNEVTGQQTGQMLSQLYDRVFQMPLKLQ